MYNIRNLKIDTEFTSDNELEMQEPTQKTEEFDNGDQNAIDSEPFRVLEEEPASEEADRGDTDN